MPTIPYVRIICIHYTSYKTHKLMLALTVITIKYYENKTVRIIKF